MVQCCIEALVCQCSTTVLTTTLHLNERFESSESEVKRLKCKDQEACCGAMLYRSTVSEVNRLKCRTKRLAMVQCCIEALVCQCSITVPTTTLHLNERFESSESEVKRLKCKDQEACYGAMLYRSTRVSV
ncbi:hypothetical protein J6590_002995 [Homalodisca vitripennis]|nr:hypothetical protein J6590_002995 [Homalodisca vitripennis]